MQQKSSTFITRAWFCLFTLGLLVFLAACGSSPNSTTTGSSAAPTSNTSSNTPADNGGYGSGRYGNGYGNSGTTPAATAAPVTGPSKTVSIQDGSQFSFSPTSLTIPVGTTVIWQNMSPAPHTATSDDGTTFNVSIDAHGTQSFKFTKAGTYTYHCSIHPYMKATIIVK